MIWNPKLDAARNSVSPSLDFNQSLRLVYRSPAILCAAVTTLIVRVEGRLVVDRNFLSRLNISQGNEEDVTVQNLHERVGSAGMIDVVRSIPAAAPIKTPPLVDRADS